MRKFKTNKHKVIGTFVKSYTPKSPIILANTDWSNYFTLFKPTKLFYNKFSKNLTNPFILHLTSCKRWYLAMQFDTKKELNICYQEIKVIDLDWIRENFWLNIN